MAMEYFPSIRKIDFVFGNPIARLVKANDEVLGIIGNVRKSFSFPVESAFLGDGGYQGKV